MTRYKKIVSSAGGLFERLQVPRTSSRRLVHNNKTKKWAEQSVWSMVCAMELGLMQPSIVTSSTRKSESKRPKPGWPGKRRTNTETSSKPNDSTATGSTLMRHKINPRLTHDKLDQRIKREDQSQNPQSFLDHRYSLPAASSFPQNLNTAKAPKNGLAEKSRVVYNPFNALRDWSEKSNIYKCNGIIDNQPAPRHPTDLSNDADTESEDLPKKPILKKQMISSSLVEYLKNGKKDETMRRITAKRRYSRRKQANTTSLLTNKETIKTPENPSEEVSKPKTPMATVAQHTFSDNISGPDIYAFNRTIKNQTGPLSAISSSDVSSENDFSKDRRNIDAKYKKESYTDLGEKMQTVTVKKVPRKRRYYRDRFLSRVNKANRSSEKRSGTDESDKENQKFSEKILQAEKKKISPFCMVKSSSETTSAQGNITVDIANSAIGCEDSEDGETLLVNPFTDLPGALFETNDQNVEIIDLHPHFNVNFDLNFEPNSIKTTLEGCFDQEEDVAKEVKKIGTRVEEESKTEQENDENAMHHNRYNCKNYSDEFVINSKINGNLSSVARPKKRKSAESLVKSNSNEDKAKWSNDNNSNNTVNNVGRITRASVKNCVNNEINVTNWTVGTIVWGKCMGWWPGLIVDAEDVGMCASEGKSWVYWISEHRISHLRDKTQIQSFSTELRNRMIETFRTKTSKDANYTACLATIKLLNDQILQRGPLTKPYHAWVEKHLTSYDNIDRLILHPYPPNVQKRVDELKIENSERTEKYQAELNESLEKTEISRSNSVDKYEVKIHVSDSAHLSLADQKPGVITWAKIMGQMWWPAMIIDFRDCGKKEPKFGCQWIIWYGDYTLSQVNHECFIAFEKGVKKMKEYALNCKREVYKKGVIDAAKDFCSQYGYKTDGWTIQDVFEWFSKIDDEDVEESLNLRRIILPGIPGSGETFQKYPPRIIEGLRKHKGNCTVAAIREHNIQDSKILKYVISGKSDLKTLCLMCLKNCNNRTEKWIDHPFFEGALCEECSDKYTPTIFAYGDDGKCFFCTVCAGSDTVVMCDENDCPRVYCTACLKYLVAPKTYDEIMINDPFVCFLCHDSPDLLVGGLLKPRIDWRSRVAGLFHGNRDSVPNQVKYYYQNEKKKLRVLSLFDGISSGLVVLNKLGLQVEAYYASEIDPDAEMVSSAHFGHQIIRLGDVRSITEEKIREIAPIHLLIGGSPCNDLSLVNPMRLGLHDPNGTGILVFEYQRVKNLIKKANGDLHFFWLFENVASMPSKYRLEINEIFDREPDLIDAANYSPQHRPRLYWNNFPIVSYPLSSQDLQDVLTPNCNRHALVKKIRTVTTRGNSLKQGKLSLKPILMNEENDSLWITELEEIFGFPRHYTDVKNLSATKRQKLIGKSWSIQTIAELMRPLCNFFQALNQDEP